MASSRFDATCDFATLIGATHTHASPMILQNFVAAAPDGVSGILGTLTMIVTGGRARPALLREARRKLTPNLYVAYDLGALAQRRYEVIDAFHLCCSLPDRARINPKV